MFPYEIKLIDGEVGKQLREHFTGKDEGFVEIGPQKWILTQKYARFAEKYYNFEVKSDDIWLMTYPKSGTTLTQELIWLVNNNLDFEKSSKLTLFERFPFFEFNTAWTDSFVAKVNEINKDNPKALEELKRFNTPGYETAKNMKSPRHFKTHLPFNLLPQNLLDQCKVVYVARNPLDVAASFYHHCKLLTGHGFVGDFKTFWSFFEKNLVFYSPYWEHIKQGWERRQHPNLLFLFYEDLVRDTPGSIRKVAKFLNKVLTDDEVEKLASHLYIDNFRQNVKISGMLNVDGVVNSKAQGFIRRGKVGGNKEYDSEMKSKAEKWLEENLAKVDIQFPAF